MKASSLIDRIKQTVPVGETRPLSFVAKQLKVSQKAVEEEVDGCYEGVGLNVGVRIGTGAARLPRSAWEVEHYGS